MKTGKNAQRSTFNAQRPRILTFCAQRSTLNGSRFANRHSRFADRSAFTLFELLAVLTVIGICLVVFVGAFGSWGTAHALTGATRVLQAGLEQARTMAMSQSAFVAFDYGSMTTNDVQTVSGFQIFLCAPTNDTVSVEAALQALTTGSDLSDISQSTLTVTPATPYQRLSGHVQLAYIRETDLQSKTPHLYNNMTLLFRPDGSAWSDPTDTRAHYLCVYTKERFARGQNDAEPLQRYLRVDLATGLVTVIEPEKTP